MTEHDARHHHSDLLRPPQKGRSSRSPSRDPGDHHDLPATPDTGESSRSGSLMSDSWAADVPPAKRTPQDDPSADAHAHEHHARDHKIPRQHHHRSHKPKSTGAFLLADPFNDPTADDSRTRRSKARRANEKGKETRTNQNHDQSQESSRQSAVGLGLPPGLKVGKDAGGLPPDTPPRTSRTETRPDDLLRASPGAPSSHSSPSSIDMDSTQIVSMALNLSEGRRLAQRRVMSQTLPPRLAPLPTDSTVGGTLKQQLQQSRRVSRTMSPEAGRATGRRAVSGGRPVVSLQPAFEPISSEVNYRYNFSSSTWARAQKAKDYMELLAQYRRVLELLPPLKPNSLSKAPTNELSPSMPMSLDTVNATGQIGRPYDPLQYIRNRKVRARERKTIDGESQGFGDVNRVTDWVDDVAKWVATRQIRTPGSPALPPFSGTEIISMESSPSGRPAAAVAKPKRPRNDWVIEPADMLADVFWLEQDDHKRLVEDRNWHRVFPQDSELYRPLSRATNDASPGLGSITSPVRTTIDAEIAPRMSSGDGRPKKAELDHVPSSTRERARQKLQEIRGFHKHGASHHDKHAQGRVRSRSSSTSSSSSSDSEKHSRKSLSGDTDKDILEKQMLEMMAREAQERKNDDLKLTQEPQPKPLKTQPSDIANRPQLVTPDSIASHQHSQGGSRIDSSDSDHKNFSQRSRTGSPQRPGRDSLEVPSFQRGRRMSITSESSAPNSPDARSSRRDQYFIPIGADLSPASSRAGSPSRNPLSRVKQIFRDRSRDRAAERLQEALSEKEGSTDVLAKPAAKIHSTPDILENGTPQTRADSVGPDGRLTSRTTGDSHRSHRKTNSLRITDHASGLRNLFKAPRIDSVLKSGVSKMGELLWKKDSDAEDSDSSASSSEDSEDESRGRRKNAKSFSPTPSLRGRPSQIKPDRQYLDVMPAFAPAPDPKRSHSRNGSVSVPLSRPASNRSTRFELLKPPRIDILAAADTVDPSQPKEDDILGYDKPMSSITEVASFEDGRRSLSMAAPTDRQTSAAGVRSSRHFSITEKDPSPDRAPISKREVARLRAMMLSSGVMAMEISRRAHQASTLTPTTLNEKNGVLGALGNRVPWSDITSLAPKDQCDELLSHPVSQADLFPVTADVLRTAIHSSREDWQSEAEAFRHHTRHDLIEGRIESLRARIQLDLSSLTRAAAEEADEVGGDLVDGQRRKVKAVVDVIDKLSRRRRRRFRWIRRAGWLALEWALVGFMWYVWFVVMIARIFLGVGKGVVGAVRWLLWL